LAIKQQGGALILKRGGQNSLKILRASAFNKDL
jgi:hypothetical protein